MRRIVAFAWLFLACGDSAAVPAGTQDAGPAPEPSTPAPTPTTPPVVVDAGTPEDAGDAGTIGPGADGPCDPTEAPAVGGIFVASPESFDGGVGGDAGTPSSPYSTLHDALDAAAQLDSAGLHNIYVAEGHYEESGPLQIPTSGRLRISGGWTSDGLTWSRKCEPQRRGNTVINVAVGPALVERTASTVQDQSVTLESVSVSAGYTPDGRSSYALFLQGMGPEWTIADSTLLAKRGAAGTTPPKPATPPLPGTGCTPSDGAAGSPGGVGGNGAGTFTTSGYAFGDGAAGGNGGAGHNGTPFGGGACHFNYISGYCSTIAPGPVRTCKEKSLDYFATQPDGTRCSTAGTSGCGGYGGSAGGGGTGGGASIAVYVSGARKITMHHVRLKTEGGGAGAGGGSGGAGGSGSGGQPGAAATYDNRWCERLDSNNCVRTADTPQYATLAAGAAGGTGGTGGAGGAGGGGAGGPSIGFVNIGSTVEIGDGVSFDVGEAGAGGGSAPGGERSEQKAITP